MGWGCVTIKNGIVFDPDLLSDNPHLVRDDTLLIENLENLGLGESLVPLSNLVCVPHSLYKHSGGHLNPRLATVDLPTFGVLTTLHDVSLQMTR